ncbi:MAG: FtsX-like permease family protein, partial [Bacteroidia bacterium]|nr:FtsX-like permease family protein [Bacteroidia bacterium]
FAPINGVPQAVLGIGLAKFQLNTNLENDIVPISVSYIPQGSRMNTTRDVNTEAFFPSGYFQVQKEYDDRYALTNIEFVQELFEAENQASTIEIRLDDLDHAGRVKERLQAVVGEKYVVQTWYEQHETLYRVMKNEKYVTFMILVLMIGILAINIVGALSMIVLEKTKDIAVLKSMGGTASLVRRVFLGEGLLVGAIGGGIGLSIALIFSFLQLQFGMIELTQGVLLPMKLMLPDFLIVAAAVLGLSFLASIYPSRSAANISVVSGLRS